MNHRLTEGYLTRHYQGAKGGRDAALLDIAQDFALYYLHERGLFGQGLVFKGGTALRKFRAGSAGRFSTDLDFSAPDENIALDALQALDDVDVDGFRFSVTTVGDDGRRGDLRSRSPSTPDTGSSSRRCRWYARRRPSRRSSRYRRVSLARDLYDLAWFADAGALDEPLVRRLWVLKTYRDVIVDGRGGRPLDPEEILAPRAAADFDREDIGYLTRPVDVPKWIKKVQSRYVFLRDLALEAMG